jgi:hypothetical protein
MNTTLPRCFVFGLAAAMILSSSCAGPTAVELTERWPEQPRDYQAAARAWTRTGKITQGYQLVAHIHATFKSPEWRTAMVAYQTDLERLSPSQRARLLEAEKQSAAAGYEIELLFATHEARENDLNKGERSMWRITLSDDRGGEVEATKIERDRRPPGVIRSLFPEMDDFDRAYIVHFPRTIELLREGASQFSLRVSSPRGATELVWRAAR